MDLVNLKKGKYMGLSEGPQSIYSTTGTALIVLNALGAIAHLTGVVLVLALARMDVKIPMWTTKIVNVGNSSHVQFTTERDITYINPTVVIITFFSLSFSFHLVVALTLSLQRVLGSSPWYVSWYMNGLWNNMAFWRWLEYLVSAPAMLLMAAPLLGVRDVYAVVGVVGSMAVTILFGWITELHSTLLIEDDAPTRPFTVCGRDMGWDLSRRWKPGSWRTRLQIHILGYAPYALAWGIIFDRFRINNETIGEFMPSYINVAVIGSFAMFTMFGFVQLALQTMEYGPSLYWLGEVVYVILSFTAKANLGYTVLREALVEDAPSLGNGFESAY